MVSDNENPYRVALGARIKKAAESIGGGVEMSKKTGIPRSTLEYYFTGRTEPKASQIVEISIKTNTSLNWLLHGQEADKSESFEKNYTEKAVTAAATALYRYLEEDKTKLKPDVFGETVSLLCQLKPDGDIDADLVRNLRNMKW